MSTRLGKRLAIAHFVLLLIAPTLTTASAFSYSPEAQPPPPSEVRLSAEDDGRQIELTEGQVLAISLESSPSTGYTWQVAEADAAEGGEGIVRQMSRIEFDPDSLLLGAPGIETLRFEPLAEGQITLQLVYRRPWEDVEPIRSFSVRVQCIGTFTEPGSSITRAPAESSAESPAVEDDDPKLGLPEAFNWCDQG
ncbi:MAG: protease inhibitor I42 family protein, partial [Anaerolineae bacterium]